MTRLEPSAWCRDDAAEASWHAAFDFGAVSGIFKRFSSHYNSAERQLLSLDNKLEMFRVPPGYVRTIRPLLKCKTFYTRGLGNPAQRRARWTVDMLT